jgi:hypothetical protein
LIFTLRWAACSAAFSNSRAAIHEVSAVAYRRMVTHAEPIMPEDLDQIAAAATKDKEITRMRVAAQ